MSLPASIIQAQKPLGGLLIVVSIVLFGGAGCATVEDLESNVATATGIVQEKTSALQSAMNNAQATYEKAKAIYEILNPEPTTSDTPTPSVPPSADQPQPVTEENISSQ